MKLLATVAAIMASATMTLADQRPVEFICDTPEAVMEATWADMYDPEFVMPRGCRVLGGVPDNIAELLELDDTTGVAEVRLVTTDWRTYTRW